MKKTISALIALVFILSFGAYALQGSGYPAYDGNSLPENYMAGNFSGNSLMLEFDPSGDYSFMDRGNLQACFFAFDESETYYIEMYLEMPADIQAGDQLTSSDFLRNLSSATAVSFYEISADTEVLYYSGAILGVTYPDSSSFEINITEANFTDTSAEVSGTLSAVLTRFEGNTPTRETMVLSDIRFHFLLPVGANAITPQPASPAPEASPDAGKKPNPAINPAPAFTLPPDYISL